jgi:hypothetical protein
MKTNNAFRQAADSLSSNINVQELDVFNRKRAARGLLPVTQEEFNELLMKIAGFVTFSWNTPTVH